MDQINRESQAQFRVTTESKTILGAGEKCLFIEQRHMHDPIMFFDIFVRGGDFDQYFYLVILLLVFGLVLM
jgi:hypothetical protein